MSNLARKHQQQFNEPIKQTEVQIKKVHRRTKITPGEKILAMLFIAIVAFMAIKIVSAQAAIYEVNKDIQDVQNTIQEQSKFNNDLELQVSDLSRYDRIREKAEEQGLYLNENNVKVVEKK